MDNNSYSIIISFIPSNKIIISNVIFIQYTKCALIFFVQQSWTFNILIFFFIEFQPILFASNDCAFYHQTKISIDFWCRL